MPQKAWSAKRERQYKHIKTGLKKRGRSENTAEQIAAATVNKERARKGESKTASRLSKRTFRPVGAAGCARTVGRAGGPAISSTRRRSAKASRDARR